MVVLMVGVVVSSFLRPAAASDMSGGCMVVDICAWWCGVVSMVGNVEDKMVWVCAGDVGCCGIGGGVAVFVVWVGVLWGSGGVVMVLWSIFGVCVMCVVRGGDGGVVVNVL
jgi:hypothetical protein